MQRLAIVLIFLTVHFAAFAQTNDEQVVRKLIEQWNAANKKTKDAREPLVAFAV